MVSAQDRARDPGSRSTWSWRRSSLFVPRSISGPGTRPAPVPPTDAVGVEAEPPQQSSRMLGRQPVQTRHGHGQAARSAANRDIAAGPEFDVLELASVRTEY